MEVINQGDHDQIIANTVRIDSLKILIEQFSKTTEQNFVNLERKIGDYTHSMDRRFESFENTMGNRFIAMEDKFDSFKEMVHLGLTKFLPTRVLIPIAAIIAAGVIGTASYSAGLSNQLYVNTNNIEILKDTK